MGSDILADSSKKPSNEKASQEISDGQNKKRDFEKLIEKLESVVLG